MYLTFRWFGPADPIPLAHIRQIPGVQGVVSALYDVPVGDAWPRARLEQLGAEIDAAGLRLAVVESIPVHEDIKLGRPSRDRLIANYCDSVHAMGELGIPVLCYNFMPVFDWMRTDLAMPLADGSTALAYDDRALARVDLARGTGDLPGWAAAYGAGELQALLAAYRGVDAERLWEHLAYFLERVVPVATEADVRMAIHPDDPPWPIFGLPRIICRGADLERLVGLVDSPANGVTFCTGSTPPRRAGAHPLRALPQRAHHGRTAVPRDASSLGLRRRGLERGAARAARYRVHRADAPRSWPHDLGRARAPRVWPVRSRPGSDVPAGAVGGARG